MVADIGQFIDEYVLGYDIGPILVVAWRLPDVFAKYKAPLTFLGVVHPAEMIASSDYEAHIRQNGAELASVLDQLSQKDGRRYGLIYLDTDHGIETLIRQINTTAKMASAETIYILPGVAPPERGMATPSPTQD